MRRPALVVASILALVLGGFVLLLATSDAGRSSSANFEIVGKVAPPLAGAALDGTPFDMYDERGNWVVVNFFASWCVGCRVEHPELVEFADRHQDDNVTLVAVMFGDTKDDAVDFFNELGGDWPALVEDPGSIHIDYGVTGVPETLLVSPSGRVIRKWIGASGVTADQLDLAIAQASTPAIEGDDVGGGAGG